MRPRSRLVGVGVIAALLSVSTATQAYEICTAEADGTFTPQFGIEPSMVVHDAILEKTLGELGVGGDPNELAFSFRRTIEALLKSAGSPSDAAAQQAFVQGLLDTMVLSPSFKLNAAAGIQMPVDGRTEQSKLSAAAMLDPASDEALKPLALFNRFDLAPDNWSHCGEHRIVYGKKKSADGARFLMIFEAMVPNPGAGADGCKPIAEFWASLSDGALTDVERGQRLSAFYYEGKTSPTLTSPDLKTPVVDYRNYGGDGGRGQVRANMFMDQPWQLREWLTQRTFDPTPGSQKLAFVPTTVKDNPLAELYHDSLAGTDLAANNVAATLDLVHGQFVQALTSTIGPRLLSETTAKHQDLVNALSQFHLGAAPVTADTVLLNTISLANDDKFNEFQSTSQAFVDAPGEPAGSSTLVTALLDQAGAMTGTSVSPQAGQILLNRARAVTCAGCHMTAARAANGGFARPGVTVLRRPTGQDLEWPDTLAFVHVDEDRNLSPALTDAFLPFRRYVMSRYLCHPAEISGEPAEEPYPAAAAEIRTIARMAGPALADQISGGGYFVDTLISEFAQQTGTAPAAPAPANARLARTARVNAVVGELNATDLAALRQRVGEAISLARSIELQRPGAFVETRRPH